jgi:putative DNA primase/helicase
MAKSLDDVIHQMRMVGIDLPHSVDLKVAFTRYLRWNPGNTKKKSAWARLFEYRSPKSGQVYITGAFGNRGDKWDVEASQADWSPAERAAELEARKAAQKAAEAERAKDAESAAIKAQRMWDKARDANAGPRHGYLEKKRVSAFGLRVGFNDRLLVPLRDLDGKLHGLQYIAADGQKLFGTGTIKEGHFHLIGDVRPDLPIAFGEGYATCAAAHMAVGWPVVACFDAGNLEVVIAAWRKLYPDAKFVVLADDDRHLLQRLCERLLKLGVTASPKELARLGEREWQLPTPEGDPITITLKAGWKDDPNGGPPCIEGYVTDSSAGNVPQLWRIENAGMAKAASAAKRHKAVVLAPRFEHADDPGTDWNDLLCQTGLEAVREALLRQFEAPTPAKKRANVAPQGGTEGAAPAGESDGMSWFERFTLIYGTTTVWDAVVRKIIRLEAMKAAYGKQVDSWLASSGRRMVPENHVVFDPTLQAQAPEWINLFDGLQTEPDPEGDCTLALRHLNFLCGEDHQLLHWLLCWLAYPLKHPGAKMRTSVIIYGRTEGTGKSLISDLMREIYGKYSRTITQRQIESEFNGWQSGMLFCVAEEVLSRQDRAHLQGLIQNMITNAAIQINEKNLPLRQEKNHTNFVFHSNSQIPMLLNDTDRRFTVIKVEQEHPPEYFEALAAEFAAGGARAFMAYLLAYDTTGFNEYTRPFENRERMALVTLSMTPDRRFFEFWRKGLAGLPFVTCTARELYTAFKAWCKLNGERFIASSTAFGTTITTCLEKLEAPPKKTIRINAYSEKQVMTGEWVPKGGNVHDEFTSKQQALVYFIQPSIERLVEAEAKPLDPEPLDPRHEDSFNRRIKLFQMATHELLEAARRSM